MDTKTNIDDFIGELNGGALKEKLSYILSEAALGTIAFGGGKKTAKVTIDLTIKQIGDNNQVVISHKLASSTPTKRGKKSEEDTTETPMFVGRGGVMTIAPPKEEFTGQYNLESQKDGKNLNS